MPRRTASPRESAIHSAVIQHWSALGLPNTLVATIPNQRAAGQAGLTQGLPDLIALGGLVRVGFIELKAAGGRVRPGQVVFHALCGLLGIPCVVTFGRDEPIAVLERWEIVRRQVGQVAA